jgi:hypothetical protein
MPKMKIVELNSHAVGPTPRSLIACATRYPGYRASDIIIPENNAAAPIKISIPASILFVYFMNVMTSRGTMIPSDIKGCKVGKNKMYSFQEETNNVSRIPARGIFEGRNRFVTQGPCMELPTFLAGL